MKRLPLVLSLLLSLSTLGACGFVGGGDSAPVEDACAIDGATATDVDGRILATPDALIKGEMAVHGCDSTSPTGDRWWLVKGIAVGKDANRQDGLLVDDHNTVLNLSDLAGHTSTRQIKVKDTRFTAACHDLSGEGTDCKVKPAEKATTGTKTITITVPEDTEVKVGS